MYLVDTNVWIERLLNQERSEDVGRFLDAVLPHQLFVTDSALHSIGIALIRLGKPDLLLRFVSDTLIEGGVNLVALASGDMQELATITARYGLDFDDAYQYVVAEKHDLTLVSFDADFDRTERGRRTPAQVLPEAE
jgi:hypothetical protein